MRTQATSPLFHRQAQFDIVVNLALRKTQLYWPDFFVSKTTDNYSVKIATESGFGIAPLLGEDEPLGIQDFSTPYYQELNPRIRGFGFSVSTLAQESDHAGIIGRRAPKQVQAINRTHEIDCHNTALNLATSSANITPDGLSLANAAHLYSGGTFTNLVTGSAAPSYAGLVEARKLMRTMPLHEGEPCNFGMGATAILTAVDYEDFWKRITGADRLPTTNYNDPNVAGKGVRVIASPYFTAGSAQWAYVSLDKLENPLINWQRRAMKSWVIGPEGNGGLDAYTYFMNEVWKSSPLDPRGYCYSAGS